MPRSTGTVIGDSQTDHETSYGILPRDTWSGNLGRSLRALGKDIQIRAFGNSGDTTQSMLDRFTSMFLYDTPTIAGIYGGVNNPGGAIDQATTQLHHEAMMMSLKHGAVGDGIDSGVYVAGQANLPITGNFGQRYVVLNDTSVNGGAARWHEEQLPTIAGAAVGPTVWEFRQNLAGEKGWGRVAVANTPATVCKMIFDITPNYLNWTTGGDSLAVPYATYTPVRLAVAAAVAAQNIVDTNGRPTVVLIDLYNFQRDRIVAGIDPDFKNVAYDQNLSWHVQDTNQHHSMYGHSLVGQAVYAQISHSWLDLLPGAA